MSGCSCPTAESQMNVENAPRPYILSLTVAKRKAKIRIASEHNSHWLSDVKLYKNLCEF